MLQRTPGIVLRQIRYSDTSLVVKVYTADYGLIGLMARGVRSAKGRSKAALLQPPNILDLALPMYTISIITETPRKPNFSSFPHLRLFLPSLVIASVYFLI